MLTQINLVEAPSGIVAGHPGAALLFQFFGDFRCGMSLFIIIRVIYIYIKIGKNRC